MTEPLRIQYDEPAFHPSPVELVDTLSTRYAGLSAQDIVADLITDAFPGQIALVSSFGTESAVLLHMIAQVDKATPVLFVDTRKLFGETLRYRDALVERLGLTDVRAVQPEVVLVRERDADGLLFQRDADHCCFIRKVLPLQRALGGFSAWINGRKGHHGGDRAAMPVVEADGERLKATPLASWTREDVEAYFTAHDLPRHPLEEDGFPSVGCYTCTARATNGDVRSGRWAGTGKTECGIHTQLGSNYGDAWFPAG